VLICSLEGEEHVIDSVPEKRERYSKDVGMRASGFGDAKSHQDAQQFVHCIPVLLAELGEVGF
jgi:hypothetical protein